MRKLETGKRYMVGAMAFEIISRTAKTATVAMIQHAGRFNERVSGTKKLKLSNWETGEVIFYSCYEIHA